MKYIPQNTLRGTFDAWLKQLRNQHPLGIREVAHNNPLGLFEAAIKSNPDWSDGIDPNHKQGVQGWIDASVALMGNPADIGKGRGSGTDDRAQPAVVWVKDLDSVVYGSKVAQKSIAIPAKAIHDVIDPMGVDAHRGLKDHPDLSKTRAQKLASKNHAVTALGFVITDGDHTSYKQGTQQRRFLSGILSFDAAGQYVLGAVTKDLDEVADYVSGTLDHTKKLNEAKILIDNYFENHKYGSISPVARDQVCDDQQTLIKLMTYLRDHVYTSSASDYDTLNKGLDPSNVGKLHRYLQFYYHSEQWLCEILSKQIENILKSWCLQQIGEKNLALGAKFYAMVIDFYSTNDVCPRCQETLRALYKDPNRVLNPAAKWLGANGFKVPKNGLRLLVRASASRWFAGGGRSADNGSNTFYDSKVDIKTLHGNHLFLESVSTVAFSD